ncbi:PAS domain S-box-containing protein/diguanylate cyclase (GGDEF)-like protein [Paucimonas lemoignei]|uniref:PAS domain S-box-containing protein/diguanylate cyclase (GGDEF)-like protein n=2 Tax=Paucimonas lemoignei TaxID=29443 RepID=A0A4R3I1G9_PAULE|nr:PAS domain S-box-containing protein/diguanylate cyclase (GGDEF)-like protein [Paucimonas lemoignei]
MIARLGLAIVVYVLLAEISLSLSINPSNTSAIWPAAGLAVAMTMKYGYGMLPVPLVGTALYLLTTGVTPVPALLIGVGNMLETLVAAFLIKRHTNVRSNFLSVKDVFRFIGIAAIGAAIGGLVGPAIFLAENQIAEDQFLLDVFVWFLGDLSGITVFSPVFLVWREASSVSWNTQKALEITAFALALLICAGIVFGTARVPLLFIFLPLLVWLAFRYSQKEVILANAALVIIASLGVIYGNSPFSSLPNNLLLLQVFVSVIGATALALTVTIDERHRATRELRKLHDELEQQISQRTHQLNQAVEALKDDIAKREAIQQALRDRETQLEEAQRLAHMGSWEWDPINDHLILSKEMIRIYGVPDDAEEVLTYQQYLEYIPQDERHLIDRIVQDALLSRHAFAYEHHVQRPTGERRYLRCQGAVTTDDSGRPVKLYGTAHDVTEANALEASLREAEELYRKVVELSPNGIFLLSGGRITFANSAGLKLLGAPTITQLNGLHFTDLVCHADRKTVAEALERVARHEPVVSAEGKIERRDGSQIEFDLAATPFSAHRSQDTLLVVRDISERKRVEQQIYHLAHHDPLTGLANRLLFKERLEHAIAQAHRSGKSLAVLFVDLDRFKVINDTSGHGAGDQVLLEFAQRLRHCLRDSDTVARTGGDEFLILIEAPATPLHVPSVAQKVLSAVEHPFQVGGKEFSIGASIGISTYPADGKQVETLIQNADIAMYRAKSEGRGRIRFYSAAMAAQSLQRYRLEAALRRALERHEMELYFQPKVDLQSGRISGAEALIRWNHPEFGLLLPYHFISIAEEMGIIDEIGMWAIAETCRHCRDWQRRGLPAVRIAVNLTYSQFTDESFCSKVSRMLRDAGLSPNILELEITETMVMENAEKLMSMLLQLRSLGIRLSVDDFGTGYSSLAYLKRLPVDSVKVDRSFIKDLPNDSEDVAITHAVLALVHSLKRSVVAEGVETREQLQFLVAHGCEEGQGYYFSHPLPAREFREFLAREQVFAI